MRYLRGFSAPVTLQVLLLVDLVGTISSYGLDCSFPIHNTTLNCGTEVLGDRTSIYGQYMEGCRKTYSTERCDEGENERIRMNIRQPQSMVVSFSFTLCFAMLRYIIIFSLPRP